MKQLLVAAEESAAIGSVLVFAFFCFFVALVFWVYRRRGRELYEQVAKFPLADDEMK